MKHIVLVALNGNARERRVRPNRIRFAKETMPRRKAAVKEFQQIDLATVERYQTEILVRNFDYIIISIETPGTSECGISPQTYSTHLAAFDSRLTLPFKSTMEIMPQFLNSGTSAPFKNLTM